jgi:hypothetical protein
VRVRVRVRVHVRVRMRVPALERVYLCEFASGCGRVQGGRVLRVNSLPPKF